MKRITIHVFFIFLLQLVSGQNSYLAHHMDWLPQSLSSNPAQRPEYKAYFGFPAYSSFYTSYSNSIALNDIFQETEGDSLLLDMGYFIDNMRDQNYMEIMVNEELINVGFGVAKDFLVRIGVSQKVRTRLAIPKSMMEFLWKGNGAFLGEEKDIGGLATELISYTELLAGVSFPLTNRIILGGNVKYLFGQGYLNATADEFKIYTDPTDYSIRINSGLEIFTAGADVHFNEDGDNDMDFDIVSDNRGFALDLAGTYILDSSWRFSGGITDLGFINWKTSARRHYIEDGDYTFEGLELGDIFGDDESSTDDQFQQLTDTLEAIFDLKEEDATFKKALRSTIFLSGEYQINKRQKAGALFRTDFYNEHIYPSLSLSFHQRFGKVLSLSANYTYRNYAFNNIGLGMALMLGPVQLYFISDNVLGPLAPDGMRFLNFQGGINFRLGSYDYDRLKLKTPKTKDES